MRNYEVTAPAGAICSSTRAELTAIQQALQSLSRLPEHETTQLHEIRICTDSRAALQLLQRGPSARVPEMAGDVWHMLERLSEQGCHATLQWVPGHAGIPGNEAADRIANIAATMDQSSVPIDLPSARTAIRSLCSEIARKWTSPHHPHPKPTPGMDDLDRWGRCTVSQLRVGASSLTRDTMHRFGRASGPECPACGLPDSITHLLTECAAYQQARQRRWGPLPTVEEILYDSATKIVDYLRQVGRSEPPVDQPPGAPAGRP